MPFNMLGVATSNLTFFRQIGGTVALAIVGTIFSSQAARRDRATDDCGRQAPAGHAQTFWVGVGAAIFAAIATVGMRELALRRSAAPEHAQAIADARRPVSTAD